MRAGGIGGEAVIALGSELMADGSIRTYSYSTGWLFIRPGVRGILQGMHKALWQAKRNMGYLSATVERDALMAVLCAATPRQDTIEAIDAHMLRLARIMKRWQASGRAGRCTHASAQSCSEMPSQGCKGSVRS